MSLFLVGAVAVAAWAFLRPEATAPSAGGGFIETRGGVVYVRTSAIAWTLANLGAKFVAPTPAGDAYAEGTQIAQFRSDGGLNAQAWCNQMQSDGLDVAISADPAASTSANGLLVAFPRSERVLWCAPARGFAVLLQAAPGS